MNKDEHMRAVAHLLQISNVVSDNISTTNIQIKAKKKKKEKQRNG